MSEQIKRKRPTRRDLLIVIGRLQTYIGRMQGIVGNDRDPHLMDKFQKESQEAFDLALEARNFDPPVLGKSRNGWGDGD